MRYTNFGSFVQRNEFFNELRKVEIDDAHTANALVSHSLSPMPPSPPPPPGEAAAGSLAALDADPQSGYVEDVAGLLLT